MSNFQEIYYNKIRPQLQKERGYSTPMAVPKLSKIVLNMGLGEVVADRKAIDHAVEDMTLIAGQKPVVTRVRRSVAGFKIRDGWPIGCKVTLRRRRMYEFFERLIGIAIPRSRDFRGLDTRAFDGFGNYSMGITEQIIFPEIDYDKTDKLRGMDITLVTTAKSDEEGLALLSAFNFPFNYRERADG